MKLRGAVLPAALVAAVAAGQAEGTTAATPPACSQSAPPPLLVGGYVGAKGLLRCQRRERKSVFFNVALQAQPVPVVPGEPWVPEAANDRWAPNGLRKGKYSLGVPVLNNCVSSFHYRSVVRLNIGGKKAGFHSGGRRWRSVSATVHLC